MKIDNYKLFEYAYNELPEEQVKEVEQYILKNPEALNLVNEYINLKYDLESIPKEKFFTNYEKVRNEDSFLSNISKSIGNYVSLDFRPNLAFAALLIVGGIGFLQIQTPQNPLLSESEITQYEVYFAALKKDLNPTLPQTRFTIKESGVKSEKGEIQLLSNKKRTQKNIDNEIVTLDPCEEINLVEDETNIIIRLCPSGDNWKIVEQTLIKK